jgi:glucose-6-phosphate isomerase
MSETLYGPRTPAWKALEGHASRLERTHIHELFAQDARRGATFSAGLDCIWLDYSRQRLDEQAMTSLLELAEQTEVGAWIEAMLAGEHINSTEDRAALHVALRRPADRPLMLDGEDVMPLVERERQKMFALADRLHAGELKGYTGAPITDIVNIGIGGSDLGLVMAAEALADHCHDDIGLHFISNIDGVQLKHVLDEVDPEKTLFVICSKTFTTLETLTNANAVRDWLLVEGGEKAVAAQFAAVSTNHAAMDAFGIQPDRRFEIWDWVGGRYSLWSSVGLSLVLVLGRLRFEQLLDGGHEIDEHLASADLTDNLPVLLALIGVWNRNFLNAPTHAVLPYDYHLHRLPAYLQQLEMESNGKSVRRNGEPVECATCPVIWGEPGSNAQHAFFQLLHQGTERISLDFILPARSTVGWQNQHDLAAANCLAQILALAEGRRGERAGNPHRRYPGDRPSSLILVERIDPATLGRLIALYEHKVFVQGILWDINSFDQWGVELGKELATELADTLGDEHSHVPALIAEATARLRQWRP